MEFGTDTGETDLEEVFGGVVADRFVAAVGDDFPKEVVTNELF